jgi:hypothetical protein
MPNHHCTPRPLLPELESQSIESLIGMKVECATAMHGELLVSFADGRVLLTSPTPNPRVISCWVSRDQPNNRVQKIDQRFPEASLTRELRGAYFLGREGCVFVFRHRDGHDVGFRVGRGLERR